MNVQIVYRLDCKNSSLCLFLFFCCNFLLQRIDSFVLRIPTPTRVLLFSSTTINRLLDHETIRTTNDDNTILQVDNIWMFRNKYPISYDYSRIVVTNIENNDVDEDNNNNNNNSNTGNSRNSKNKGNTMRILLLNGFGMGTFHQHRLMNEIANTVMKASDLYIDTTTNVQVYAMDYLGQGKSWPIDCQDGTSETEIGLQYSAQTWLEQIVQFIEQVILQQNDNDDEDDGDGCNNSDHKVHLVGNSLGGYLATYVAALRPDLIESLCLLNATPIWGLNLPGWTGHLPAPIIPKIIGRYLFDTMRNTKTIYQFLNETYMNNPIDFHPQFVQQIQSCTNGPGGHAAFASILWSPPLHIIHKNTAVVNTNYYDCIQNVQCHVLLCYGQNDPWCKPIFAKKMLQRLISNNNKNDNNNDQSKIYKYIELSNVGHCPNHEAPIATSNILMKWFHHISSNDDQNQKFNLESNMLLHKEQQKQDKHVVINESWGTTIVQERSINDITMSWIDRIVISMI